MPFAPSTALTIRRRTVALFLAAGLAAAAFPVVTLAQPATNASKVGGAEAVKAAERPTPMDIRKITMYRSGVGSFQRQGQVDGDASVQLRFKTEQINDILKSMVVLDLSGGQIEGISYGSKEPLAKRLASFGVDISDNPDMAKLLGKLRGAVASVTTAEGAVSGTILGVEMREQAQGQSQKPVQVAFLNLVTGTGIRSFDLSKVTSVELQDKELAGELGKALAALAEHRADRTKTVEIALRGRGARNVVVNYIHEMPVWKASYRLVLPDESKAGEKPADKVAANAGATKGSLSLQGWAIVENPTDEDWKDVTLSLVSGRPVSFQMDLYEPLYVFRPEIPVPTVPGVMPRSYAGGVVDVSEREKDRVKMPSSPPPPSAAPESRAMKSESLSRLSSDGGRGRGGGETGKFDADMPANIRADDMAGYSATARAQAVESGEVFQYQLKTPVTIERQRSAMLPIITEGIQGRRVSIFSRADGSEHPMRGIEITNTTELQLLPGPISVYDSAAYAGDAQIGHVAPGDKRLLAYAVDLDVNTITKDESRQDVRTIKIVSGMIEQKNLSVSKITYQFTNKNAKHDRTIIIEHPKQQGFELKDAKPAEETPALYRFEVSASAGKTAALTVTQEMVYNQRIEITSYDLPTMMSFQTQGKLSPAVVAAFKEAQQKQAKINDENEQIVRLERERTEISTDQTRVRENMKAIDKSTALYGDYIKQFSDQEARMKQLNTEAKNHRETLARLQNEYSTWLAALSIE